MCLCLWHEKRFTRTTEKAKANFILLNPRTASFGSGGGFPNLAISRNCCIEFLSRISGFSYFRRTGCVQNSLDRLEIQVGFKRKCKLGINMPATLAVLLHLLMFPSDQVCVYF